MHHKKVRTSLFPAKNRDTNEEVRTRYIEEIEKIFGEFLAIEFGMRYTYIIQIKIRQKTKQFL